MSTKGLLKLHNSKTIRPHAINQAGSTCPRTSTRAKLTWYTWTSVSPRSRGFRSIASSAIPI
ncbi:hypothetical protein P691DRAFT_808168 [Macrolepiota fuliginosa MF-IS2]|uniref:Uncharacterized protein n=1 Tax=Macrolepiota fuliginosa MF-IS2 TaxID=1400762 RepID=A0A9P5X6V9_9AGAR|nr:hypothetical protein P691DRAFT_808168 [Macrolepiota fuliginosa MF-IS2]